MNFHYSSSTSYGFSLPYFGYQICLGYQICFGYSFCIPRPRYFLMKSTYSENVINPSLSVSISLNIAVKSYLDGLCFKKKQAKRTREMNSSRLIFLVFHSFDCKSLYFRFNIISIKQISSKILTNSSNVRLFSLLLAKLKNLSKIK